jgi:hypothetical protein
VISLVSGKNFAHMYSLLIENALILGDFDYVAFDVTGALKFAHALNKIHIAMRLCERDKQNTKTYHHLLSSSRTTS